MMPSTRLAGVEPNKRKGSLEQMTSQHPRPRPRAERAQEVRPKAIRPKPLGMWPPLRQQCLVGSRPRGQALCALRSGIINCEWLPRRVKGGARSAAKSPRRRQPHLLHPHCQWSAMLTCTTCCRSGVEGVAEPSPEYDGDTREAAGKLPCATTLSALDAAVVTRRRRRVTSFAFPSGGAPGKSSPRCITTPAVAAAVQWQQHAAPSGAALAVHPDAPPAAAARTAATKTTASHPAATAATATATAASAATAVAAGPSPPPHTPRRIGP